MQYLKDEVRQRILTAALEEFRTKGYMDASIRSISKLANISSGNIYRYFVSKDSLFEEIVGPIHDSIRAELKNIQVEVEEKVHLKNQLEINELKGIEHSLLKHFETNRDELMILLFKSKGSPFEHLKDEMIQLTEEILKLSFIMEPETNGGKDCNPNMVKILAATVIEATCIALQTEPDGPHVKKLINEYLQIHSLGVRHFFG